jgi:hypothetical protein
MFRFSVATLGNPCASIDSFGSKTGEPRAPEAGKWFDYQTKMLSRKAHL